MNQTSWFGEKNVVAGLLAGFFGGKKKECYQGRSQEDARAPSLKKKMPGEGYRVKKAIRRVKDFLRWRAPPLENSWLCPCMLYKL
jgi:hypothetical protein